MSKEQNLGGYPTVDFKGDCGESKNEKNPNCAVSIGMAPHQEATVNGSPVSNCVIGNDEAKVYNILLTKTTGIYTYQVSVDAQGPKGAFSGYLHLAFTDESGDTYYLKIYSSSREQHTVNYNSDKPNIVKIWWCNYDFIVPSNNSTKPDYSVTSPDRVLES